MDTESLKIGNYTCKSREEYDSIKYDVKIISAIKKKYNLSDPVTVKKVLGYITKNNLLNSKLGLIFRKQLADFILIDTIHIDYSDYLSEGEKITAQAGTEPPLKINKEDPHHVSKNSKLKTDKSIIKRSTNQSSQSELHRCIEIPIIVPASSLKNSVSIVFFGIAAALIFYLTYKFDTAYGLLFLGILMIYLFAIACNNISYMNKAAKKITELSQDNDEKDNGGTFLALIIIGVIILCVIIPPLGIILLIIRAIISAIPKIKWMFRNIKSGILGFLMLCYFYGLIMTGEFLQRKGQPEDWLKDFVMIFSVFFISIILICITAKLIRKQVYLSIRTMATFPVMLFLTVLPFVGIGLLVYTYVNSNDNNYSAIGNTGTYLVSEHYRHTPGGGLIYIAPYPRTYPDGILTNNLSYRG